MINIDDKYKRTMKHFGDANQFDKLREEMSELYEAINHKHSVKDVEKELADVINVAMQFIIMNGGSPESVINECTIKMIRTEKRIASGYYE